MRAAIRSLTELARLNTRLVGGCLDGLDDRAARRRISVRVNNAVFIALHVLDARCYLGRYLDLEIENPWAGLVDGVQTIEEMSDFPPIAEVAARWDELAPRVTERLSEVPATRWRERSPQEFPIGDRTVLGGTGFLLHHESYHIGQLAFLRKRFGLPALRYA